MRFNFWQWIYLHFGDMNRSSQKPGLTPGVISNEDALWWATKTWSYTRCDLLWGCSLMRHNARACKDMVVRLVCSDEGCLSLGAPLCFNNTDSEKKGYTGEKECDWPQCFRWLSKLPWGWGTRHTPGNSKKTYQRKTRMQNWEGTISSNFTIVSAQHHPLTISCKPALVCWLKPLNEPKMVVTRHHLYFMQNHSTGWLHVDLENKKTHQTKC